MKAVIIGGGEGCRAIIKLALGTFLKELTLDIISVADPDINAPGMVFARHQGIRTTADMKEVLSYPDVDLVIELTGKDDVLENIYKAIPRGVKVFDHTFARLFVNLSHAQRKQTIQLQEIMALEQEVEKERTFLQTMFDKMPEMVAVLDNTKCVIKANASFSLFTGFYPHEIMNREIVDLIDDSELAGSSDQTDRILDDILKSHQQRTFVWQSPPPNDTIWEITHTPVLGSQGTTDEILCTWHRITEQAILQRRIESAETRFTSFMNSAHDWISVKDMEGRYVVVNKATAESLNLKSEDFIGKKPEEILPPNLAKMVTAHDNQVIEDDCHRSFTETVRIDGHDRHFLTNRFPLKDYKGCTKGICTIMRDVTSETTLRNQLEQSDKLAAIGKLAAGVAHEINNPLTGILAFAEDLAADTPEDNPHYNDLMVIVRETLRCRSIVKNLLDFSRLEDPRVEPLDPNVIVERSFSLVEKLPQFRDMDLIKRLGNDVPFIQGDPHQIQQVVLNFMLNAAEAIQENGRIAVTTKYDRSRNKSIILVEDNGPGIPENLKDKIFEPFFSTKGTNGLGLAVSWGIIERHLGSVEVEESESGGAAFAIVFPIIDETMDPSDGIS